MRSKHCQECLSLISGSTNLQRNLWYSNISYTKCAKMGCLNQLKLVLIGYRSHNIALFENFNDFFNSSSRYRVFEYDGRIYHIFGELNNNISYFNYGYVLRDNHLNWNMNIDRMVFYDKNLSSFLNDYKYEFTEAERDLFYFYYCRKKWTEEI